METLNSLFSRVSGEKVQKKQKIFLLNVAALFIVKYFAHLWLRR